MINNKGFTLVELLATIVVIGILILITVPNMVGVIDKNKDSNYIADARRMQSLAEYRFRSEDKDKLDPNTNCLSYTLEELNKNQEFDKTPDDSNNGAEEDNNKKYDFNKSFVAVKKVSNEYKYYVFLMTIDKTHKYANFNDGYNLFTGDDDSKKYKSVNFEANVERICPTR